MTVNSPKAMVAWNAIALQLPFLSCYNYTEIRKDTTINFSKMNKQIKV